MNWVIITSFLSVLLFFLSATPVFAKLYVNEFSSAGTDDWVEIYNDGTTAINLASFRLRDSTETNKFDLSGSINPGQVLVFDWYNKLNKAGDTIRLLHLPEESVEDQMGYGDHGSDISEILEGSTGGRNTDGGSSWIVFSPGTKGLPNAVQGGAIQTVILTPVPTLSPSLTPMKSPTPQPTAKMTLTKTPTPTKSPTPTRTPTPIKVSATFLKTTVNSNNDTYPTSTIKKQLSPVPTSVLGVSTQSSQIKLLSPTPKKTLVKEATEKKEDIDWIYMLIGGGTLLFCAILTFFKGRRRLRNEL